jgi:hypothetical protein
LPASLEGDDERDPIIEKSDFSFMSWEKGPLAEVGLSAHEFPVPSSAFAEFVENDGQVLYADLLYWFQRYAALDRDDWQVHENALKGLIQLIAPEDDRETIEVKGEDQWALDIGPVDLSETIITIQRNHLLLCAIRSDPNGRLIASPRRPLDSRSLLMIISASMVPGPDGRVAMRPNNWEYLLDQTASNGQFYAFERGDAYLSFWEHGLGICHDGEADEDWMAQRETPPLLPSHVATQLGVHYSLDEALSGQP